MTNSPVLLLIFNRIETTKMVFDRIRDAKPTHLFVAADGPRIEIAGEKEKCELVRNFVLDNVDWECNVKTLFRDKNLGCGHAPAEAISWFFENVEQGIVLEDDCLPALSFFKFCDELLEKYKDEEKVFAISGTNLLGEHSAEYSYFFSVLGGNWGWASWRRAWKNYDFNITLWNDQGNKDKIRDFIDHDEIYQYYKQIFDAHIINPIEDVWDYQWLFARLLNCGLSIIPSYNQIRNVGFGKDATHTFDGDSIITKLQIEELNFPLQHVNGIIADERYDENVYEKFIKQMPVQHSIIWKIKSKIKSILSVLP